MLYYIHGYQSGPNSKKGSIFKKQFRASAIRYRSCPPEDLVISDCLDKIYKIIEMDSEPILIGSSLGGFLAAKASLEKPFIKEIILLNPALIPPYFDIEKIKDMPQRILKDMKDEELFKNKINAKISIIIGRQDSVVPNKWSELFAEKQEAKLYYLDDDHRFSQDIDKLIDTISKILNKKH